MKAAIVYLTQNTAADRQYGRNSRAMLERSLDLLFKNYNDEFQHDVLIFHEGDFTEAEELEIADGRKTIKFVEVHLGPPDFLSPSEIPDVWVSSNGSRFGVGYRNMIRFYAVSIFDILHEIGYEWVLRLDDDSFLHSRIEYNLFDYMAKNGYEYGYRVDTRDSETTAIGFGDAVLAYLAAENVTPTFFWEHVVYKPKVHLKNIIRAALMRVRPHRRYRMRPILQYDLWGYYNNFFITKIAFWRRRDVQAFIRHFDRIGGWYKYRWGDLIFQSATVQIFLDKDQVHKFTDWTYEHATIKDGRVLWGGVFQGSADSDLAVLKSFKEQYGVTAYPPGLTY
jgi:alpha 1,2-mannosyltransferase